MWIAKYIFPALAVWFVASWLFGSFRRSTSESHRRTRTLVTVWVAIMILLAGLAALGFDYLRLNKVWH